MDVDTTEAEQFRRLVLSVRDYAIFLIDPDGRVATWNLGAEQIKGYTAAEIIGSHFSRFYTEVDRRRGHPDHELERAVADGRYEEEGWRVRKDGTRFWASVVITALHDDDGAVAGFAKVTRDLTARREAEEALRLARDQLLASNEELDRFAAVAAHDLHEPLRTVAGFSQLLSTRYGPSLDDRARLYLDHISQAVERMDRLIENLLAFARGTTHNPGVEPVDLLAAVNAVVGDLDVTLRGRSIDLAVDVPAGAVLALHAGEVEAVLANLLSNAAKFAAPEAPVVTVRAERVGGSWRIEVTDNGIGIASEEIASIFQPFHRLHGSGEYPGTGLGLAIAQRTVHRNGGDIGVESVLGQGSRFWFSLPAADLRQPAA